MKPVVGLEPDITNREMAGEDHAPARRSFSEWARELAGCRLCRNLTLAAFAAILAIEVAILIPSYRNYEEDLLSERVDVASQAIITFLKHSRSREITTDALELLIDSSPLTGVSLRRDGIEYEAGEAIRMPHPADGLLRSAPRTPQGTIDLSWGADPLLSDYEVLARVDVSDVSSELIAFVFRILGLSLLIAVFVTAVTMFVVDRMMLSPLLRLRDRISRAGEDAEHPLKYLTPTGRCDEFGEVEGVFNGMLKQNAAYLSRLKLLNRELDQLLAERTRTLRRTEQELEIRTLYDQLTGLANRSLFEEQVDRHFSDPDNGGGEEAVLVLGLNDFQTLNGLDGQDARTLLSHAEIAMHRAKKSPSQRVQFFASEFGDQVLHRQELIHSLKAAIENRQLQLYFQPQCDRLRRNTGYEALLRWHHPTLGPVSPAEFIPLAEETGLIVKIGDWVLEQAVATLKGWSEQGFTGRMAVNVSALQLHDPGFADRIAVSLRDKGVSARQLELEITETALMQDIELAMATLNRFRELDLTLAVDDFGTGYSSLAYLKALPVSRIKIDRTFVTGLPDNEQDEALCRTIINMAHTMGCEVIAEGVETEAQASWLALAGCDELQGYLLGKPGLQGFQGTADADDS